MRNAGLDEAQAGIKIASDIQSMGSWRVGHGWVTSLSLFTFMHWRRKWQPTPVFLPGESWGQRAAIYGVAQSQTRLKRLSSSSSRYADDTTLMAESEEEPKSLLMKVKEETERVGLKLNHQKTKIMASGSIGSWQIDGATVETVTDFTFLCSKTTADGECSHESLKDSCSLEEKSWPA